MPDSTSTVPPGSGTWILDTASSSIGFVAKALFGLKVKGHFERFESTIVAGDTPSASSAVVTIRADSVSTGIGLRDKHLRADDVFASDRYATLEFRTTSITETPTGLDVAGNLRVRDVTSAVTFHADASTNSGQPTYTAEVRIDPKTFGISRPGTTKPVTVVIEAVLTPAGPKTN